MSEYTIKVTVQSQYLEQYSQPQHQRFAFAYTISIQNCSETTTQLLSRHWVITDAKNTVQEVVGDGVVGEQPHILPGETFTYSSNAVIETNVGTMEGCYTMQTDSGVELKVPVPMFSLASPQSLH